MNGLPITLDLTAGPVLVVGGGEQATQKLRLILAAGGAARVVASEVTDEIADLARAGRIAWAARDVEARDFDDPIAVFVAETPERAALVAAEARARRLPVNVVDAPALSTFQMPAIVDRDPVTIAIATGGLAPALSRHVRARIEAALPARLGDLARFVARWRPRLAAAAPSLDARRRLIDRLIDGPAGDLVLAGDEAGAEVLAEEIARHPDAVAGGVIHLVGAGPGDPDLLTLAALRVLGRADIVFHDQLVAPAILDRVRRDAIRHYVGKSSGRHSLPQDEIAQRMIEAARQGQVVVRLKGGDPFIFGRGGEEMLAAEAAGIPVVIVPGITAALGCAAAAGIPLTQRHMAGAVSFVTGHRAPDGQAPDWAGLAGPDRTLVVYMGREEAGTITAALTRAGVDPATPVALVENGSRPNMTVATGALARLPALAAGPARGPALIIVGDVVRLAPAWSRDQQRHAAE